MRFTKRWLAIGGVVLALVIAASIGSIAVMADTSGSTTNPTTAAATPPATATSAGQTFLDKVVAIYQQNTGVTLNETALQNAITQAKREVSTAELQSKLQSLVSAGKLTQDQANQILSWWQSMPGVLSGGNLGFMHGLQGFIHGLPSLMHRGQDGEQD